MQVTAPCGQYDDARLVNVGTNRWSIKPEIGFSKTLEHLVCEMTATVTWYHDNEDFVNGTLKLDPIELESGSQFVFGLKLLDIDYEDNTASGTPIRLDTLFVSGAIGHMIGRPLKDLHDRSAAHTSRGTQIE